jgi:hypothetical protein
MISSLTPIVAATSVSERRREAADARRARSVPPADRRAWRLPWRKRLPRPALADAGPR